MKIHSESFILQSVFLCFKLTSKMKFATVKIKNIVGEQT